MKKIIDGIAFISSIITGIVLISTFLTSYQFYYVGWIFNSYSSLISSLAITMFIWSIKFWKTEQGKRKIYYTFISFTISMMLIYLKGFVY